MRRRYGQLWRIHRWLGASVALALILLVITGWLLNHTTGLKLAERYCQWPWVLQWYGVSAAELSHAVPLGEHWLSQWQQQLYWDQQPLSLDAPTPLVAGVAWRGEWLVALQDRLLFFSQQGQWVETLYDYSGIPTPITALVAVEQQLWLATSEGMFQSQDGSYWQAATQMPTVISEPVVLPLSLQQAIQRQINGGGVSWERVVQDLHSGRIFGSVGVWVVDLVGLLLLVLAATGLMTWWWRVRR